MAAKNLKLEDGEQIALFQWAAVENNPLTGRPIAGRMFGIMNGARVSIGQAKKMKRMGLKRGVSDVFLSCGNLAGRYGLYIEMKKQRQHYKGQAAARNAVSDAQKEWIAEMRDAGYWAVVCYGWEEAREQIMEYLNGR